jgi:hypothetical protein
MGQKAERHTSILIRLRAYDVFFCFPESEGLCTVDLILGWNLLRIADFGLRFGSRVQNPQSASDCAGQSVGLTVPASYPRDFQQDRRISDCASNAQSEIRSPQFT